MNNNLFDDIKLTQEEFLILHKKNDLAGIYAFLSTLTMFLCYWATVQYYRDIFLINAICLILGAPILHHRISVLAHEAAHRTLFRNDFLNSIVEFFSLYLIFFTHTYRKKHMIHHRKLGSENDPDLDNYLDYPINVHKFILKSLKILIGYSSFKQLTSRNINVDTNQSINFYNVILDIIGIIFFQTIIIVIFSNGLKLYILFWILPLATTSKYLTHLRAVAEHAWTGGEALQLRHRTIHPKFLEKIFFAPLCFNYHAEHHLYPSIPWWRLKNVHTILSSRKKYPKEIDFCIDGYISVIKKYVKNSV